MASVQLLVNPQKPDNKNDINHKDNESSTIPKNLNPSSPPLNRSVTPVADPNTNNNNNTNINANTNTDTSTTTIINKRQNDGLSNILLASLLNASSDKNSNSDYLDQYNKFKKEISGNDSILNKDKEKEKDNKDLGINLPLSSSTLSDISNESIPNMNNTSSNFKPNKLVDSYNKEEPEEILNFIIQFLSNDSNSIKNSNSNESNKLIETDDLNNLIDLLKLSLIKTKQLRLSLFLKIQNEDSKVERLEIERDLLMREIEFIKNKNKEYNNNNNNNLNSNPQKNYISDLPKDKYCIDDDDEDDDNTDIEEPKTPVLDKSQRSTNASYITPQSIKYTNKIEKDLISNKSINIPTFGSKQHPSKNKVQSQLQEEENSSSSNNNNNKNKHKKTSSYSTIETLRTTKLANPFLVSRRSAGNVSFTANIPQQQQQQPQEYYPQQQDYYPQQQDYYPQQQHYQFPPVLPPPPPPHIQAQSYNQQPQFKHQSASSSTLLPPTISQYSPKDQQPRHQIQTQFPLPPPPQSQSQSNSNSQTATPISATPPTLPPIPVMFQALPPPPPPPPLQPPNVQSGSFVPHLHHPGSLMPPYKHSSQLPPPQIPTQQLPTPMTETAPPPPPQVKIANHDSPLYGLGIRPSQPPIESSTSHKRNQSYGSNRDTFIKSETRFPISNQDSNNSRFTHITTTLAPYSATATPNQGQEPSYTLTQPPVSIPFSVQPVDPSTDMGKSVTSKNSDSTAITATKKRARSGGSFNPTRSSISGPDGNSNNTDSQKHLFHYYYNSDTLSKKKVKQSKEGSKSGYRSVYIDDVGEKVSSSFDNRKRKKTAESTSSSSTQSKAKSK